MNLEWIFCGRGKGSDSYSSSSTSLCQVLVFLFGKEVEVYLVDARVVVSDSLLEMDS